MPRNALAQLVVEGKNDQRVISALCNRHGLSDLCSVEIADGDGGIDRLLESIPIRLKISNLQALGIVVDADQNLQGRWDAVKAKLNKANYSNIPPLPVPTGTIIVVPEMPRVGIWIMPNNILPGMLEDFTEQLIAQNDLLVPKVQAFLNTIENEHLNQYQMIHRK